MKGRVSFGVQLRVVHCRGALSWTPTTKCGAVTEPAAGKVVVGDLDNKSGAK